MIKSIEELELKGKRVLLRVDFNVPLTDDGKVADDKRIVRTLPTIDAIIKGGGIPVIVSHLGRPKGAPDPKFSLKPVSEYLINKFGYRVLFCTDFPSENARKLTTAAVNGEIILLENIRFFAGETKNDPELAKKLAKMGDIYVNDAFGTAHRAHASTAAVAELFSEKAAGKLMMEEVNFLQKSTKNPERPFTAILGGAKVSDKLGVIENLINKCDNIVIGGGMAFTFLKAMGKEIGKSLLEAEQVELTKNLLEKAKSKGVKILLPADVAVADKFEDRENPQIVSASAIPADALGMDIGTETVKEFEKIINTSKTIVWNGPMGVFEFPGFAKGTFAIASAVANATKNGALSVIGGGDSASAVKKLGFEKQVSYISTGGGATLEFLEGKELPGVKALEI